MHELILKINLLDGLSKKNEIRVNGIMVNESTFRYQNESIYW